MNTTSERILRCYKIEGLTTPHADTLNSSFSYVAKLLDGELYLPSWRKDFYDLLKKVQDSPESKIEEEWRGNWYGYILRKETITILNQYRPENKSKETEEVLTVSLSLFLQALHEWEDFLKDNFPQYANPDKDKSSS